MDAIKEHNLKYKFFSDITGVAMNLTHMPYGMLINFGPDGLYSEWYQRYSDGDIERIKLL